MTSTCRERTSPGIAWGWKTIMHAIEFEATTQNHAIRLPDNVPEGVRLRVLLLSPVPLESAAPTDIKSLLANVAEGLSHDDLKRSPDSGREEMEWTT